MATIPRQFSAMTSETATSLGIAVIASVMVAVVLFAPPVLGDGDTYWHLATGFWILDHRQIPHTDTFSYTMAGRPWLAQEWLSEVIMAVAYRAAGWSGEVILFAVAAGVTVMLLGRHLGRWLALLPLFLALVIALALLSPSLLARPHLLALPVMEVWSAALVMARAEHRAPSFWLLPVMVLWTNLHASFPAGLVLAALLAGEAAQSDRRQGLAWLGFTLAAAAVTLINPNGLAGVTFPLRLMNSGAVTDIIEWQPAHFRDFPPIELVLALVLYLMLVRGFRLPLWRFVIFAGLIAAALLHVRNQMLVGIIGILVIAPSLGAFLGAPSAATSRINGVACFAAGLFLLSCLRLLHPLVRGDDAVTPMTALAHVPAAVRAEPVFNDDALGGYLIFSGVKPFIDGRADLYGADFMTRYQTSLMEPGPLFAAQLDRYKVTWAIVSPRSRAAVLLAALPHWRRDFAGATGVIYERD